MKRTRRGLSAAIMALLAAWLLAPAQARAQWTTPDASNNINNTNTANVGVGTTTPTRAKVQIIKGSLYNMAGAMEIDDASGTMDVGLAFGADSTNHIAFIQSLQPGVSFTTRPIVFNPNGGSVGIGTASPQSQFHVSGASGFGTVRVSGSGGGFISFQDTAAPANQRLYQWRSEGGVFRMALVNDADAPFMQQNILVANSSGNVGIGTASPQSPLDVAGGSVRLSNATSNQVYFGTNGVAAPGAGSAGEKIQLYGTAGSVQGADYALGVEGSYLWSNSAGGFKWYSGSTNKMTLDSSGNLTAAGTITGATVNATYQDVAEWVPSSQKLQAGTVVILDTDHTNQVLASSKSYDTKVAGVVSARPGISLGEGGDNKLLVATTGRVKVKVDATRAPIKVGDLLVTSDEEGVAMKSIPVDLGGTQIHRPGTIIGKALEPLASGTGEILVLLSLQ